MLRRRVVTHKALAFFGPMCDRPGCHEPPVTSIRNPGRYCGPQCRQAMHDVRDRERKWLSRGSPDGRTKRAYEYRDARRPPTATSAQSPNQAAARPPPETF